METIKTETRLETISRNGGFKKASLPDVHITPDERGIEINRVGVEGVAVPIVLNRKGGGEPVKTLAKVNMFGSLEKRLKGTNMCYDDKTEILSKEQGWIPFNTLKAGSEVATLSPTGYMEWQPCSKSASFDFKGDMYSVQGRCADLVVTPNHNLVIDEGSSFSLIQAQEMKGKFYKMRRDCLWSGEDSETITLKSAKQGTYKARGSVTFKTNDFMKLAGFYLAEGCSAAAHSGYGGRIILVNNDKTILDELKDILVAAGLNPCSSKNTSGYEKGNRLEVVSKPLFEYFSKLGLSPVRYIPTSIKNLSSDHLKILTEYYMKGDGSRDGKSFYTASAKLAGDLQEVFLKIGKQVSISSVVRKQGFKPGSTYYACYLSDKHSRPSVNNYDRGGAMDSWIPYDGKVFCCEVPNHTLLVRRNGKMIWSGNSRFAQLFVTDATHSVLSGNAFPDLLEKLSTSLDTKDVYISASFDFWMNKTTPVSKISAPSGYSCRFIGQLVSGKLKFVTEVNVPVASYCPCSKEMCLTDKATGVGLGAHAQRGIVTLQVRTDPPTPGLWLEDMIRIAETSGSAELYPILKREDEKYVTIAGYDNPKFVEDISRDVGNKVQLLPEAVWYKVRTRNLESIHPYDVTSYVGQSKKGDEWVVDTRSFY